jgi:hypothetical protein
MEVKAEKTKLCRTCGYRKPYSDYNKNPKSKDGVSGVCASCRSYYHHTPPKGKSAYPFKPVSPALSVDKIQKIPRTPDGDAKLLKLVEETPDLDSAVLAALHKEAPHRSCYIELVRILLAIESAKMFRR